MGEREMQQALAFLRELDRLCQDPAVRDQLNTSSLDRYPKAVRDIIESAGGQVARPDTGENATLDALLASIPDPAWVTDVHSRMLGVNAEACQLLGLSREQMLGRTIAEYLPATFAAGGLRDDRLVLDRGEPLRIEEQVPGARGAPRWLETVKSPLRGTTGEVFGIFGIARDVTERKQAVDDQRESLGFFAALDRLTKVLAQANDIEGLIVSAIETTRDVFQCDRAWMIYPCDPDAEYWRVHFESTHPNYPGALTLGLQFPVEESIAAIFQEALTAREPLEYGGTRRHPWADSEHYDILSQLHIALRPKVGQAWLFGLHQCSYPRQWTPHERRLLAAFADRFTDALTNLLITRDLRHSVQALKESEANFRAIAENASAAILLFSDGRNVFANEDALKMTGYSASELAGLCLADVIAETAPAGDHREFVLRDRTGLGTPVEVSQAISQWQGRPAELVFVRDISERKRVEDERRNLLEHAQKARAEAEKASLAKDSFLGVVSHELRTPLTSILAWAQMLRRGTLDQKASQRAVETIERLARAQSHLVDDLLDFTRVVSGKFSVELRPIDLVPVVLAPVDSVRPLAEGKGVELVAVGCDSVMTVMGEGARLQQVLWNLLNNAIKFTPKGGRVTVDLATAGRECLLSVEDTGHGISPEFMPHLFDPFTQADASSTRAHGGLGLGLAIVHSIVECHGGRIRAASDGVGHGATFNLALPLAIGVEEAEWRTSLPEPGSPAP